MDPTTKPSVSDCAGIGARSSARRRRVREGDDASLKERARGLCGRKRRSEGSRRPPMTSVGSSLRVKEGGNGEPVEGGESGDGGAETARRSERSVGDVGLREKKRRRAAEDVLRF